MSAGVSAILEEWRQRRIPLELSEEIDSSGEFYRVEMDESPYKSYLHSTRIKLDILIKLIKLKNHYRQTQRLDRMEEFALCLEQLRLYDRVNSKGLVLYLQILRNRLTKLKQLIHQYKITMNGQFYNLISSVIIGYKAQILMEFPQSDVNVENLDIVDLIQDSVVIPMLKPALANTRILILIKYTIGLTQFIKTNLDNSIYYSNFEIDWKFKEINDNLINLQIDLPRIEWQDLRTELLNLVKRFDELDDNKNRLNTNKGFKLQMENNDLLKEERRRSSGLQFSLVKVCNDD